MERIKGKWKEYGKAMAIIFILGTIICFFVLYKINGKEEIEPRSKMIEGLVVCFDISSYNYLGDGTAAVYDYTSVWQDEVLINDCVDLLDKNGKIKDLVSDWDNMDNKSKRNWLLDKITIKRFASSTMYSIVYSAEISDAEEEVFKNASSEVLSCYLEYATDLVKMTDENLQYKVVKEIDQKQEVLSAGEEKVNTLLYMGMSMILGLMLSLTYLGIKIITKNKKN